MNWQRGPAWTVDALFATVLGLLLLPLSASAVWESSWSTPGRVAVTAVLVVAHLAVVVRRTTPLVSYAVVCAVMVVLVALPEMSGGPDGVSFHPILLPSTLVFPVLLHTVAAWCSRRESLLALAAACVGATAVTVRLWGADYLTVSQPGLAGGEDPVRSWPLFLVVGTVSAIAVPWGLGRHRRRARMESARAAAAEERIRIARELHDVVAHSLSVMVTQAEGGRMMAARDPAVGVRVLETVARTGQEAMRDMRDLLDALNDPGGSASQPGLRALPELIGRVRASGLAVSYQEDGTTGSLGSAGELAAYRVVQEALTNVLKHAGTDGEVEVALSWRPDHLAIAVENHAAQPPTTATLGGRGLVGMRDRLAGLDGSLHAGRADDGFRVAATIPTLASSGVEDSR
ncbi:sensor histidine kinase [Nocardioides sp. Root151]|uniref:sensor histidine kinase n=1 Tax=Nocardioides sp. Root151 TaxID=1736475 RepID=UPI0012E3C580|nr:histidine kinase [Nocardioides sp. Root151]